MVKLDLSTEEAGVLAEILSVVLSDLRMEITDTEKKEWRDGLKQHAQLIRKVIAGLQAPQ